MEVELAELRRQIIARVLAKQDEAFRWGFEAKQARERPETLYYSPNFKSTLWTLVLLADLQAPAGLPQVDLPQVKPAMRLVHAQFYDPESGIFRLPGNLRFPIPCLSGNMLYLHSYFGTADPEMLEKTIAFFNATQRFDDGDFKTPQAYPYCGNIFCYGKHSCYWGVTKLFKGISFIPRIQRSAAAQELLENCVDFILRHEVCFSSRRPERFLHPDISQLTFPNFYKSDFLEILWLLAREGVHDERMARALDLLRSKRQDSGSWALEKPMNILVSIGDKGCANAFITERARQVLAVCGH
jgi:hypothetical protein